jgi:hypothetical protein
MVDLGRLIRAEQNNLAEFVLWLDGQLGSLGLEHDQVREDSAKAFFIYWSSAYANNMSIVSQLSRSQS